MLRYLRAIVLRAMSAGTDSSGQSYCDNCGLPSRDCACPFPKR